MNRYKSTFIIALVMAALLLLVSCVAKAPTPEMGLASTQPFERLVARFLTVNGPADFHNPVKVAIPTTSLTATPGVMVVNSGVGVAQEWRNAAGTPMAAVNADGSAVFAGSITSAGAVNGGGVLGASFAVAPTTVATNTPVFYTNMPTAAAGNAQEWRRANTPEASINYDGAGIFDGVTTTGGVVSSGGMLKHTGPTPATTATPAAYFNNAADVNDNAVFAKDGTAYLTFRNGGAIVATGDTTIGGALAVTGAQDFTGATNLQGAVTAASAIITGTLTTGIDGTAGDVTFYSDTAGDTFLWDQSEEALILTGTAGQVALSVADGNLSVTDDTSINTLTAAGAADIQGALTAASAVVTGTTTLTGATTAADDITITGLANGDNAGARAQFIGLPRIKLVGLGQGTNPGSQTIALIDATPTGEWVEADAGTNLALTADTSYYRDVTNSVKLTFTDVVTDDGAVGTISEVDLTDMESIGFWIYSTVSLTSGDFAITLDSDATDPSYNVPAVTANTWTWVEMDISACNTNCAATTGVKFLATAQGGLAHAAASVYLDAGYVWDAADEEALGVAIQRDGVLSVINTESGATLVEWTDWLAHEESGVDFIVWITDQSTADAIALVAY